MTPVSVLAALLLAFPALHILRLLWRKYSKCPPEARTGLPFVGAAVAFGTEPLKFLLEQRAKHGDVFVVDLLLRKMVFIMGPAHNRLFFGSPESELSFDAAMKDAIANVLEPGVWADPDWNKRASPQISDCFMRSHRLEDFLPLISKEADRAVQQWMQSPQLDLFSAASTFTIRCTLLALLGEESLEREPAELVNMWSEFEQLALSPFCQILPFLPFGPPQRMRQQRDRVLTILDNELRRLARIKEEMGSLTDMRFYAATLIDEHGYRESPVSRLFAKHIAGLLLGGHINLAATIGWTVFHLAKEPRHVQKVRAEFAQSFGDQIQQPGFKPQTAQLQSLEYLDACMKESGRRYSHLLLLRQSTRPIPSGDYVIPAGSLVAVSPIVTHHDSTFFEEPFEYRPERFVGEQNKELLAKYVKEQIYVQFGFGRHKCLGSLFAGLVFKTFLAKLFSRADVALLSSPTPKTDPIPLGSFFPASPIYVKLSAASFPAK
jgi:sterol 14-demethylase